MRKKLWITTALIVALVAPAAAHAQQRTVVGPERQRLIAAQTTNLSDGQVVRVTGTNYNRKVGIYLAFCEMPTRGQLPRNCAGGVNLEGESESSFWISSNPPAYAAGLVKGFTSRGGFIVNLKVSRFIGQTDCAVKKCAILTRADHTRSALRSADVLIPVSFRK
jgi:hypothetical protein